MNESTSPNALAAESTEASGSPAASDDSASESAFSLSAVPATSPGYLRPAFFDQPDDTTLAHFAENLLPPFSSAASSAKPKSESTPHAAAA